VAELLAGLDVSHFQKTVDWPRVAAAGKVFSFLKASEGALTPDAFFDDHRKQATANKIAVGAYHLFHPGRPVADQVKLFVGKVKVLEPGELPPVLDLEVPDEWKSIAKPDRVTLVVAWLTQVEQALGVPPIIYGGPQFIESILGADRRLATYRLWLADYALQAQVPDPWSNWTFWQFTDKGAVDGVTGKVDLDTFNGSRDDLNKLLVQAAPAVVLRTVASVAARGKAVAPRQKRRRKKTSRAKKTGRASKVMRTRKPARRTKQR